MVGGERQAIKGDKVDLYLLFIGKFSLQRYYRNG